MINNDTSTSINMNNSSVQLKSKSIIPSQQYSNSLINQLNPIQKNVNNEENLSTKANINQDENKILEINSTKSNSQLNDSIEQSPQNLIKKDEPNINNNNPYSNTSFININDKPKFNSNNTNTSKKTPLSEYLQSGYKKYPHARNSRYLIQHYKFWEGYNYFPYSGHLIEGPCSFRPTFATGLAVTLPVSLFIGFNAEFITNTWTKAILIVCGVICLIVLTFLVIGSFRDPGIIRRHHFSNMYLFERKTTKINQLG